MRGVRAGAESERIRDVSSLHQEGLKNQDNEDIFVLNLQSVVQAVIDPAAHVGALRGGLPHMDA